MSLRMTDSYDKPEDTMRLPSTPHPDVGDLPTQSLADLGHRVGRPGIGLQVAQI